jgi:hypothetical protein
LNLDVVSLASQGPLDPVPSLAFAGMNSWPWTGTGMIKTTERQVQETIGRCVSAMVDYHDNGRASERMVAEVQLVAGFVEELDLSMGGANWRIIGPVEDELIARFGREIGARLIAEFVKAFDGQCIIKV